ncbi:MAG: hypothetical protein JXA69_18615 [Phycisphaerae bacterium]|nr:hypothetical protein [Phycisphaerae bacterium]
MAEAAEMLAQAVAWARSAGQIARERFGAASVSLKADDSPVTDADHAVQAHILNAIAAVYSDHAVVTEETVAQPERHAAFASAEFCWVVDPIDGTRNYARHAANFAVSIAVLERGTPIIGVVYDVMTDRMYSGRAGAGACCDGTPMHVADEPPTGNTLIGTASGRGEPMADAVHDWFDRMTLRNLGSTELHLAMVAAGSIDAAFCHSCRVWDVAAGALLVSEAGGVCTSPDGQPCFPIDADAARLRANMPFLAAGPRLHRYLFESLRQEA